MHLNSSSPCTRRLLWDLERHMFLALDGGWTPDPEKARSFTDMHELLVEFENQALPCAEVVEHYGDRISDLRMVLTQNCKCG